MPQNKKSKNQNVDYFEMGEGGVDFQINSTFGWNNPNVYDLGPVLAMVRGDEKTSTYENFPIFSWGGGVMKFPIKNMDFSHLLRHFLLLLP